MFIKTCETDRENFKSKWDILAKLSDNDRQPHQSLLVQKDHERKMNYYWSY